MKVSSHWARQQAAQREPALSELGDAGWTHCVLSAVQGADLATFVARVVIG
jgi:hypothetical protein